MTAFDWAAAATRFGALRDASPPSSPEYWRATFGRAVALQHRQPGSADAIAEATRLYQDVADHAADDALVARSRMGLGRIAELVDFPGDSPDFDAAGRQYAAVMRRWPDEPIGSEAALRAGAALVMAYDRPQFAKTRAGVALLERWLADHPDNPYAAVMWQYAGDAYFRPLGDRTAALRCYTQADRLGWADPGNQGGLLWRCARIAEADAHDAGAAAHFYRELIAVAPTSAQAYPSVLALRRLGEPLPPLPPELSPTTRPAAVGVRP